MKLVIVLCLAAGALAYMPPSHWPQPLKASKNANNPAGSWRKGLKSLLAAGLDEQVYHDAKAVLKKVDKFLRKNNDASALPEDIINELERVGNEIISFAEDTGLYLEDSNDCNAVAKPDWKGCLTEFGKSLVKCGTDIICIITTIVTLVKCLTKK
ncbi:hypothetical protein O0L34_g3497 [Tuta absoluta]|nr:hypothetical protein O0L34_g3497 [Tuta absoluta]